MEATNILLVEDEPVDAARVRRSLEKQAGGELEVEHVTTLKAAFERIARGGVDAVLLDLNLPDGQGIDSVARLREPDPALPIVVLTGTSDEETAVAALAAGAQDYLVKDELEAALLQRTIRYAIERSRIALDKARLERRLHKVEKWESLGALCAGMGFGFNPLIGSIFELCDDALVALDAPAREDRVRRDLFEIHRAAFRAAEMVQRLRDYGAIEHPADGSVDLARFVLEASDLLEAMVFQEIDVVCEVSGERIVVDVTRPELHRILMSLVLNAADAIGACGGTISISVGVREVRDSLLAESEGWPHPRAGRYAFLRVADDGPGLGAAERARIFDPFYSTRFAGRGLGLASVAGILHQRRAVALVEANRPTGTIFTILFPLAN